MNLDPLRHLRKTIIYRFHRFSLVRKNRALAKRSGDLNFLPTALADFDETRDSSNSHPEQGTSSQNAFGQRCPVRA